MQNATQKMGQHRRLIAKLGVMALLMFGFGFLLVPLYNVMCDVFGINGRFLAIESGKYDAARETRRVQTTSIDTTRTITVKFLANRNQNLSWEFRPLQSKLDVHPGEVHHVTYYAKNLSNRKVVAQAVPSLVPGDAVKYFSKIECFCFTQQTLAPGESREMPLRFMVDPNLPKHISLLTLAYTFFDTENLAKQTRG